MGRKNIFKRQEKEAVLQKITRHKFKNKIIISVIKNAKDELEIISLY